MASTRQVCLITAEIDSQANESAACESVARRIERQVVVAARNFPSFKETLRKRLEYIDAASHSIKHIFTPLMMEAQASPQAPVDRVAQQPCNQGLEVWRFLNFRIEMISKFGKLRGIEKEEPNISNGNAAWCAQNLSIVSTLFRRCAHWMLSRSLSTCSCAVSGFSNQYSCKRGPIPKTIACRNHSRSSPTSPSAGGVT